VLAPDKKYFNWPSSEVKAALEHKKELKFQSKILERAKIEALVAIKVKDTLSNFLGSEEGEEEYTITTTDVNNIVGSQDPAAPIEVKLEGEDKSNSDGEGDDNDKVIMIVHQENPSGLKLY
jgi:hypothetical protein